MFEKFKVMQEEIYKKISHSVLFWVSMIFTVMLFLSFTNNPFLKLVWFSMAVAVELTKNYLIKEIKTRFGILNKITRVILGFSFLYLIIALVSSVATFGAVKLTLEEQEVFVQKSNVSSDNIEFAISQIDKKIERLNRSADASISEKEKMSELESVFYTGIGKMTADTKLAEEEMISLLEERTVLTDSLEIEDTNTVNVSKSVFDLIGEDIGLTGAQTLFWVFMALILILEISLFATTDPFFYSKTVITEETESEEIFRYIDALEKSNSVVLNSDINISNSTGMSKKSCVRYRNLLKTELKWRGKPLINSNNRTEFNNVTMKRVISEYFMSTNDTE